MKRFITSLAAAAVLSMPITALALQKMDNSQLKAATGQAGVSIAVDDIVIYQKSLADTTYWDTDAMGDGFGAAGIMIDHADEMQKLTTINAILDNSYYGVANLKTIFGEDNLVDVEGNQIDIGIMDATLTQNANGETVLVDGFDPSNGNMAGMTTGISPLTIDVGTCEALTRGWEYNVAADTSGAARALVGAVAGVVIGLPTVEISTYTTSHFKTVKLVVGMAADYAIDHDNDDTTADIDIEVAEGTVDSSLSAMAKAGYMNATHNNFITIEKSGNSTMAILGGRLEIAPH